MVDISHRWSAAAELPKVNLPVADRGGLGDKDETVAFDKAESGVDLGCHFLRHYDSADQSVGILLGTLRFEGWDQRDFDMEQGLLVHVVARG